MASIEIHRSHDEAVDQNPTAQNPTAGCTCGEVDEDLPELDVQTIPHAIRHAAIFGAIDALRPGAAMIISATHNPIPLLSQLEARYGDAFNTAYLEQGPERWRIIIRNVA
nr:DUF2249 domain-containing protein [Microbacterium bovistercoris]